MTRLRVSFSLFQNPFSWFVWWFIHASLSAIKNKEASVGTNPATTSLLRVPWVSQHEDSLFFFLAWPPRNNRENGRDVACLLLKVTEVETTKASYGGVGFDPWLGSRKSLPEVVVSPWGWMLTSLSCYFSCEYFCWNTITTLNITSFLISSHPQATKTSQISSIRQRKSLQNAWGVLCKDSFSLALNSSPAYVCSNIHGLKNWSNFLYNFLCYILNDRVLKMLFDIFS